MRTPLLRNLHDMLCASPERLAAEYISVVEAVDHEFRHEAERTHYAALIHAYGMHMHADCFPAAVAECAVARRTAISAIAALPT